MAKNYKSLLSLTAIILIIGIVLYIIKPQITTLITQLLHIKSTSALMILCALFIGGNLFLLPVGLPLNLIAGILWGTFRGGLLINMLAVLVASLSFFLARRYGAGALEKWLGHQRFFQAIKTTVIRYDWQFILMARLNPIAPFSLSNYGFGLISGLAYTTYFWATLIGNLLPCFILAALGATLKENALSNPNVHFYLWRFGGILCAVFITVSLKLFYTSKKNLLIRANGNDRSLV